MTKQIAIVTSRFNEDVTRRLQVGAISRLKERGFTTSQITSHWVPGAVEIPLVAQNLARTKKYAAIICLGAVIRGETSHYDYVCEQVSNGCQRIALDNNLPVIFGVLTTENEQQALDRAGGRYGNKGIDAADAALEMIQVLQKL